MENSGAFYVPCDYVKAIQCIGHTDGIHNQGKPVWAIAGNRAGSPTPDAGEHLVQ